MYSPGFKPLLSNATCTATASAVNALADGSDDPAPVGWRMGRASDQAAAAARDTAAAAVAAAGPTINDAENAALAKLDIKAGGAAQVVNSVVTHSLKAPGFNP
jgi:hypothetical protein